MQKLIQNNGWGRWEFLYLASESENLWRADVRQLIIACSSYNSSCIPDGGLYFHVARLGANTDKDKFIHKLLRDALLYSWSVSVPNANLLTYQVSLIRFLWFFVFVFDQTRYSDRMSVFGRTGRFKELHGTF